MRKKIVLSAIAAVSCTLAMADAENVDLGMITVDSSTITEVDSDEKREVSTVNIIDEEMIEEINPKNINDLLQTIPGITADVRSDVVEIHIRGIGQQEFMWEDTGVAVVIDGVPVLQDGGKVRGLNIDEIESIKVIKGGASYLYGNTALAGAIIITTKKSKNQNKTELSIEQGSFGYEDYKVKRYGGTENYSFNILAGYKKEDGYWYKTYNDQKTLSGKVTYYIDDTSDVAIGVDITKKYQESTRGSVTGVTNAEINPEGVDGDWAWSHDYYSDIYKYYITYNKNFNDGASLATTLYYYEDLYEYESSPQDLDDDGNDDVYTRDSDDDIEQYGVKIEYKNSLEAMAYMVGLDVGKRESEEYDETLVDYFVDGYRGPTYYYDGETSLDSTTEDRMALYGELKYDFSKAFSTTVNVRYDYDKYTDKTQEHDYDGSVWTDSVTEVSKTFHNVSYRLGTAYKIYDTHTLFANLSTGFRNPTASQYATNPDLDTETTINYEIGMRGKVMDTGIRYEASLFITDTNDIISKDQGTYYWTRVTVYENVGDARNQGLELSLNSDRNKPLSFNLAYTYLDSYYRSHDPFTVALADDDPVYDITDNELPRVPHHKVDLIVNYKPNDQWKFMTEFYAQSDYYADETNFVKMPGYGKVNVKATYNPTKQLEFYAQVNNLFDKQYYRTVYLFSDRNDDNVLDAEDASITVDPGRAFYVGLKYKF